MKCPMCKSRNVIEIEVHKGRQFKLNDEKEITIYPQNKCLNCNAEFNMTMKPDKN